MDSQQDREKARELLNKELAEDGFDVEITADGSLLPVGYRRPPGPKQSSVAGSDALCRIPELERRVAALEQAASAFGSALRAAADFAPGSAVADALMQSAGYGPSQPPQGDEDPEPSAPEIPSPKNPPQGPVCGEQERPRTGGLSLKHPEPPFRGGQG